MSSDDPRTVEELEAAAKALQDQVNNASAIIDVHLKDITAQRKIIQELSRQISDLNYQIRLKQAKVRPSMPEPKPDEKQPVNPDELFNEPQFLPSGVLYQGVTYKMPTACGTCSSPAFSFNPSGKNFKCQNGHENPPTA